MSGLRGNPRNLRSITKNLGSTVIAQRVAARAAPAITTLALAAFDRGETPYGDAWPVGHDGRPVDMVESGALRAKVAFVATGTRIRCLLGVKYAKFQIGKRKILPSGNGSLPTDWRDVIHGISLEELQAARPRAA